MGANKWDDANIGEGSTGIGSDVLARGQESVAIGWANSSLGVASVSLGNANQAEKDASVAIGAFNQATDNYSIAMGNTCRSSGEASIATGYKSWATGNYSSSSGYKCEATGVGSTASGYLNIASGAYSTAFGQSATASGYHSFALGYSSVASGSTGTAIGFSTTASGEKSTAIGSYVSTNGKLGSFIIGDASTTSLWTSALPNQMKMRFAGGYQFYTNSTATTGVYMNGNTSGWINFSDRNMKEHFTPVAGEWLLAKIRNLPVTEWNYKNSDPSVRYIGPMAQDFWQAFHLGGTDSLGINSIAIDGVNLAAIKALEERTSELQAANDRLEQETRELRTATEQLKELSSEAAFSRAGEGQLKHGRVHIELDTEITTSAIIDALHPLKVFVQLEDDCNGVYITNKTATGFDVIELQNGRSYAKFSYRVLCQRNIVKYPLASSLPVRN